MNYAALKKTDVANGPGVRVSLFVSGCTHYCKGCFNREAWDFCYGNPYTEEVEEEVLEALEPSYIRGLSVLGGEPFEEANRSTVLGLLKRVKERYPEKTIWCYTGYDYEKDLMRWILEGREEVSQMLSYINVLVDGEFVEELKNLKLPFRGSENQRLIDVEASVTRESVIEVLL
uniref:anaerobic ribonucleoside-triphosphate reductase activating protein n=1 Tax=Acetatifactor sp. TaxID=1872090 RepID=UPI004056E37A